MSKKYTPSQSHEFLLCPVSAEARIAKNNSTSSLSSTTKPRFDVHLVLDKVPLQLTDSQYRNTLRTYKSFMRLQRHCRLRHYRPFAPVKGNVPQWWGYAIRAVLTLKGYRRRRQLKTMEEALQRAKDNVAYVKVYEQHLTSEIISAEARQIKGSNQTFDKQKCMQRLELSNFKSFDVCTKDIIRIFVFGLDRVETELHYDEIIELREIVMLRMEKTGCMAGSASTQLRDKSSGTVSAVPSEISSQANVQPSRYGIMSWVFPSWSYAVPENSNSEMPVALPLSPEQSDPTQSAPSTSLSDESVLLTHRKSENDLDEAILGDVKAFGRDALLARFNFKLEKGTVALLKKSLPFLG